MKNGLTINKGCFNCIRHEKEHCNTKEGHGLEIDVMKIQTNPQGQKYRCGCCCGNYKAKGFKFR